MNEFINYETLLNKMKYLGLEGFLDNLDAISKKISNNEIGFLEAIDSLVSSQIKFKKDNVYRAAIKVSHFPFIKTMDDFEFDFQPSLNKAQILNFCALEFLNKNENIIFFGTPGTGKTHLATAIGIEVSKNSKLTYFITCKDLVWQLKKSRSENNLERRLKHFASYSLLIIDEIGHDILSEEESNDLFQLLQMRYEKHSTILTTNYNLSERTKIFPGNKMSLNAMLDRFLHHSHLITINGPSYRTKEVSQYIASMEN